MCLADVFTLRWTTRKKLLKIRTYSRVDAGFLLLMVDGVLQQQTNTHKASSETHIGVQVSKGNVCRPLHTCVGRSAL
jgi:hypothetical protein